MFLIFTNIKMQILIISMIVLLFQWPLAIWGVMKLFSDSRKKTSIIIWNVIIIAVPIVGPISYLIFRKIKK